jgi:hypothetical protein
MKKLIKKNIFNGIIRIIVSIIFSVYSKFKHYNINVEENKPSCEMVGVSNNDELKDIYKDGQVQRCQDSLNADYYHSNEKDSSLMQIDATKSIDSDGKKNDGDRKDDLKSDKFATQNDHLSNYYEYINDSGNIIKVSSNYLKQSSSISFAKTNSSIDNKNISLDKKCYKIRAIVLCILVVIGYVSLNNYLIMLVYYKSSASTISFASSQVSDPIILSKYNENSGRSLLFNMKHLGSFFNRQKSKTDISDSSRMHANNYELEEIGYFYDNKQPYELRNIINNNSSYSTVYVDQEDLEVANINKYILLKYNKHLELLPESYFDEEEDNIVNEKISILISNATSGVSLTNTLGINLETNRKKKYQKPCVHPKLNPYDSEIMQFVKKEAELKCNPKKNWVYIENGRLRVSKSAINKHGSIVCAYIPLYRGNTDFNVYEGARIFPGFEKYISYFFKPNKNLI